MRLRSFATSKYLMRQVLVLRKGISMETLARQNQRGPQKITHISPTYFDHRSAKGGGERFPTELARAMAKIAPTELVSFGDKTRILVENGLTYRIYRPWWH